MSREAAEGSGRRNEQWGYPGTYDSTEQAGEDGSGSVGDSEATPMIVVVVVDVGGVGRRKKKANAEEEEAEEDDETKRASESGSSRETWLRLFRRVRRERRTSDVSVHARVPREGGREGVVVVGQGERREGHDDARCWKATREKTACLSVCLWRCESVDGNASVAGNESGPSNQRTASRSRERDESRFGGVDVVVVDSDSDSDDDDDDNDDDDDAREIVLFHRDDKANPFTWHLGRGGSPSLVLDGLDASCLHTLNARREIRPNFFCPATAASSLKSRIYVLIPSYHFLVY
ncbi:hypothetical protein ALC56_03842 [Trachymyrmex septentrionalis]|uniref:Uncharacterized protein n=1 Tax=Trachymyrmex septentrionalis TaxID=34720 RepID=A0A195FP30_9HYME|nr:hypothetical protein ALC56_03842 [Trachymyrmex septentrionalis]